jgi:hypothetical protein
VTDVEQRRLAQGAWTVHVRTPSADLCVVDALARLQLAVGRHGGRIVVHGADDELQDLLDLAGLTGVVEVEPTSG